MLLVLAVVIFQSVGDLSLAYGMKHIGERVGLNPLGYVQAMLNPFVTLGICLLVLWLLTRMALLSWADLSFVLPLTAIGYVLAAVLGKVFLHETVMSARWLGSVLVFSGVALVGTTSHKTRNSGTTCV
jgi:uncharacterized membrane protein